MLHVGALDEQDRLGPDAPRFEKVLSDVEGRALWGHQLWQVAAIDDDTLPPGGRRTVELPVTIPAGADARVDATLWYRSHSRRFLDATRPEALAPSPTSIAEVSVEL